MNLRAKFVIAIDLLGLLCLMLAGSLRADTVYTYTGNAYTYCSGTYASGGTTCAGTYALSITFDVIANTPRDNLIWLGPGSDITADVSTFSFTDGTGLTLSQANSTYDHFYVATDSSGNFTQWYFNASNYVQDTAGTYLTYASAYGYPNGFAQDTTYLQNYTLSGSSVVASGSYTTMAVGEPSCFLLLGIGLLGFLALAAGITCFTS